MLAAAARRSERIHVPPRRYHIDIPQAIAVPAKTGVLFMPDHWQARKWRDAQRLPAGVSAPAVGTVPDFDPGHTFVVHELVRAGDPITLHSTKKIPTAKALIEKKENRHIYYHKSRMVYRVPRLKAIFRKVERLDGEAPSSRGLD